jgi:AP-1 complex subunit mu
MTLIGPSQVNANGNVVRSEILGAVKMKCYLSGMPELRLGLNDKVMFESTGRSTCRNPTSPPLAK